MPRVGQINSGTRQIGNTEGIAYGSANPERQ